MFPNADQTSVCSGARDATSGVGTENAEITRVVLFELLLLFLNYCDVYKTYNCENKHL